MTWPPPCLPDSDMAYEEWVDSVATGLLDPDFLVPARLPGRPLRNFTNVAAPLRRDSSGPSGRSSQTTTAPSGAPLSPPLGAVPFFENEE